MKHFILSMLLCIFTLSVKAQDMASLFAAMPDQNIPQLENAWRKDLIDLYNSGKEATLKNTMTGSSTLKKLTADYLQLQSTERTTMEMKLLPLVNNTNIICVVTTVHAPVADSRVDFYTTEWKPLQAIDLYTPVSADWFIKEEVDRDDPSFRNAASRLDMELIQYNLSPENQLLTATYMTPAYLNKEEQAKIMPYLKESPKVFTWEKFQFK